MFSLRQQPAKSDQRGSVTVWTAAVTVCSVSCISWVRHQHTRVLRRPARCWYRIHHSVSLSSRSSFFPSIQSLFLSACGARRVNMKVFSRRFSGEPDSALEKVDIKCLYRDDCILNLQWKKKSFEVRRQMVWKYSVKAHSWGHMRIWNNSLAQNHVPYVFLSFVGN